MRTKRNWIFPVCVVLLIFAGVIFATSTFPDKSHTVRQGDGISWEQIGERPPVYRLSVPGGWLVLTGSTETEFLSDPKHEWLK